MNRGEIRRCDPEVLAYTLLGIGHFAGQRWELWGGEKPAEKALPDLISLILYGALKEPHATKVPCDY